MVILLSENCSLSIQIIEIDLLFFIVRDSKRVVTLLGQSQDMNYS
jgi:hypothetical protein